jgi:hypothetical protein
MKRGILATFLLCQILLYVDYCFWVKIGMSYLHFKIQFKCHQLSNALDFLGSPSQLITLPLPYYNRLYTFPSVFITLDDACILKYTAFIVPSLLIVPKRPSVYSGPWPTVLG